MGSVDLLELLGNLHHDVAHGQNQNDTECQPGDSPAMFGFHASFRPHRSWQFVPSIAGDAFGNCIEFLSAGVVARTHAGHEESK